MSNSTITATINGNDRGGGGGDGSDNIIQNGNLKKEKANKNVRKNVNGKEVVVAAENKPSSNAGLKDSEIKSVSTTRTVVNKGYSQRNMTKSYTDFYGNPSRNSKPRSRSINAAKTVSLTSQEERTEQRSHSINKFRDTQRSTNSMTSEGFIYDGEMELEEPFSDSDDDTSTGPKKLTLPISRGRIRTLSGTVPAVGYSPKWGGPTMCLSCLQFFVLPEHLTLFAEHLLNEHRIVIVDVELIVDPKRYVEYWRQRFAKQSIDTIFPKIMITENGAECSQTDYYFEISEKLPEDYALRQNLAMRRLEEALACQQREREDTNYAQQCIFCRYIARGNRSKMIHHLYTIHHLNLGSPDNLVFVAEYIECLKSRLLSNECIYCEKRLSDRNTLMEHMRRRNHKEVNPKNHYYDKFYIINYLELGKRWLDVLKEDFEDTMPTFVDSDEEEEEESWQEWQQDNIDMELTRIVCLFCDETTDQTVSLLEHMKAVHHFDILGNFEKENLDVYDRMKLINFIRKENYNGRCFLCGISNLGSLKKLRQHYAENNHLSEGIPEKSVWCMEENLVPLFDNDHLTWMVESYIYEKEGEMLEEDEVALSVENIREYLQKQSEANTVQGVVAEDLPELQGNTFSDLDFYESMK